MKRVFIDGSAGTTGLRIHDRLSAREDIELITLEEKYRKDAEARREALNSADIVFLCLPDDAAKEAVGMISSPGTAVIDTSTAHRTSPGWEYGFPELDGRRSKIKDSKRVANPGCHASGFIALVEPLVRAGIIGKETKLSAFSVTGYSGGGKKMIAQYESGEDDLLEAPRMYGLGQNHKHLPEMKAICMLDNAPIFCPVVAPYYSGMQVTVPLFADDIRATPEDIKNIYREYYTHGLVRLTDDSEDGFTSASFMKGRDDMILSVLGNEERIILTSRFDNLGKGASGAAVQNMNIMIGAEETEGLVT